MTPISISLRVWLILLLFAAGLLTNFYLETSGSRKAIESCYESNVESVVEIAKGVLHHYHARQLSGELSEKEAQRLALEAVSAIRYGGGNYVFMGDAEGTSISNGIKELVGTNIMGMQDPTGFPLVRQLYETAANGGGYVHYQWPSPTDKSVLLPKTSYADYFPPWQWTLGSGLNLEALKDEVDAIQQSSLINLILVMITVGGIVFYFVHRFSAQLSILVRSLQLMASGKADLSYRLSNDASGDLYELSAAYNQLAASLEEMGNKVRRDGGRFYDAMERMQLSRGTPITEASNAMTLNELRDAIDQICTQAERIESAHESLKAMAEHDVVTGLLSPPAFETRVRALLSGSQSEASCFLALVAVESIRGQDDAASAELVSRVAEEIRHQLAENHVASYLPGTGFAFCARYANPSEGVRAAIALQGHLQAQLAEQADISVGVSSFQGGNKSYELLFSEAERAVIRAQKEGGNRVYEY